MTTVALADDLYILRDSHVGRVKIGRSMNVDRRVAQLQAACPTPLVLVVYVQGAGWLERTVHEALSSQAVGNEWFEFDGFARRFVMRLRERAEPDASDVLQDLGWAISGVPTIADVIETYDAFVAAVPHA